ncbi:cbl-interacting protein kinase 2 [Phtheirospermum japonicum]|uniref:non-specific serine/threonine protein kinase n=1 Tax=Phtheirospermum japonicum TaxID=374723 RepID=A0A830D105_9LAMI|nr:cbl-interacting protein kinase 2 [Phtheirospermum japonicum]
MQKYEIGRMLGQGTFAKVYYGRNLETGQSVAIKVKHANIIHLEEVLATKTKIYFVMEYAKGGELFQKVSKGKLRDDTARRYFQQLIRAVDFCHSRGVYHRDLKPENLLLDENGNLKVSDFGLSALSESKRLDGLLHTTCGTPAYVAPEVISRKGYDGAKADIWSCGVILFVLLAGYLPFHDSNLMEMYRKISKGEFKCPNWFPSEARRLLLRILDPNPNSRITIAKIMENKWFRKGLDSKAKPRDVGCGDVGDNADVAKPVNLNAFDIISLSTGFDLSGLFVNNDEKDEVRFTSAKSASCIASRIEEIAGDLKLRATKKEQGYMRLEGSDEGRNGNLSMDVRIFEITPLFHLVEVEKCRGDSIDYQVLIREGMRPALKEIVWAWQGEQQHITC